MILSIPFILTAIQKWVTTKKKWLKKPHFCTCLNYLTKLIMPIIIVKLLILCSNLLPKSALEILAPPLLRCPKPRPTSVASMSRRTRPRRSWWRTPRTTRPCRNPSQNSFVRQRPRHWFYSTPPDQNWTRQGILPYIKQPAALGPIMFGLLSLLPCWTVYKRWKKWRGQPSNCFRTFLASSCSQSSSSQQPQQ